MQITIGKYDDSCSDVFSANLTVSSTESGVHYCTIQMFADGWPESSHMTTYASAEAVLENSLFNRIGFEPTGNATFSLRLPKEMSQEQAFSHIVNLSGKYGWFIERI